MGYIGLRLEIILLECIWQKLWDILDQNYGLYYALYWLKLLDIFGKIMGYTGPLDILSKN